MFRVGFVPRVVGGFSGSDDEFNSGFELGYCRMAMNRDVTELRRTEA
jgi:hypothetical protein